MDAVRAWPTTQRSRAPAISSRDTRPPASRSCRCSRSSTRNGSPRNALCRARPAMSRSARTPFYLEAGGQVSDAGRICERGDGRIRDVDGLARIRPGLPRAHRVRVTTGALCRPRHRHRRSRRRRCATPRAGTIRPRISSTPRCAQVLGTHVKQAGSLVAPDRLRFDFVHFQPVTDARSSTASSASSTSRSSGTPPWTPRCDRPRKRSRPARWRSSARSTATRCAWCRVPGFSMELCGGTHVRATGDIGLFVIVAEGGVAAGVRRIEALTGLGAVAWIRERRATLAGIVEALHVKRRPGGRGDRASCSARSRGSRAKCRS